MSRRNRTTIKGWLMAMRGKTCSNCAWKGHYHDKFCGFPSCESPRTRHRYVEALHGIKEYQEALRIKDAYGRRKCTWKAIEENQPSS